MNRCKEKRKFTKEEYVTFSVTELCASFANNEKWFNTEGRSKGANGKVYSSNKRLINAELKRRRREHGKVKQN